MTEQLSFSKSISPTPFYREANRTKGFSGGASGKETLCHPVDCPWDSPGQNTGVGSRSLLQGIFPTQGWNPALPHCQRILYQLSYQGSPILEVGSLSLLQGIFPTQELNPGSPALRDSLAAELPGKPHYSKGWMSKCVPRVFPLRIS